jgi:hypothetical protein
LEVEVLSHWMERTIYKDKHWTPNMLEVVASYDLWT